MKKGFGLLEVLAAAVVLAFLLIGLNTLQKGNREGVLRVRARDAANTIAQDIIDSISALGLASVVNGERTCSNNNDLCRRRIFRGEAGEIPVNYSATVRVEENNTQVVEDNTQYINATTISNNKLKVKHQIAKQIKVEVRWTFKNNSEQKIEISSLIK